MTAPDTAMAVPQGTNEPIPRAVIAALAMVAAADWLLYGEPQPGISIALFFVALALAVAWTNAATLTLRTGLVGSVPLALALLPGLENPGLLPFLFAAGGTAVFALAASGRFHGAPAERATQLAGLIVLGPFRLIPDAIHARAIWRRRLVGRLSVGQTAASILPVILFAVFMALFAKANPVFDRWLAALDISALLSRLDAVRFVFWFLAASFAWAFIRARREPVRKRIANPAAAPDPARTPVPGTLLGASIVLRSLLAFNLLFAVQTALDLAYLWGGLALPDGITHAEYAHRGAYPLVVVALLSAAFVLVAMRPGGDADRAPAIRVLVLVWIGQNVLLVVSSVLRLDLYIEAYSLTVLRVAAFIWMGLVAAGLVLIVVRILFARSNAWLIGANALTLIVTLYATCFVNWPYVIARYNVDHSFEIAHEGPSLDAHYLYILGPQTIPVLEAFVARLDGKPFRKRELAETYAGRLRDGFANSRNGWRRWSLRDQRLADYLSGEPDGKAGLGDR